MNKGYLVRRLDEVEAMPCPCGMSTRLTTIKDQPLANIHVTQIRDMRKHYHKEVTEFYYILEGTGVMELGDDKVDVDPGTMIVIEKGTPHRGTGDFTALIAIVPAHEPGEDEHFTD